ncbi:hypothetical protein J1N35_014351 [Gossypium stocksii]|uniref:Uncharacterized protein n=1 Tax=Gossypium stocksii TaxID=47602 RepID=A0A9D4A8T1_9ROSI|nr:hypothetical protein J1N35_014351 [Gossypium stocksii]
MSRRVKFVIYYDGQICNTEVRVVFVGANFVEFTFNSTIQMRELRIKIRKKAEESTRGRIIRSQCIFLAFVDPYKYELFDVVSQTHLETVISLYISSENVIIKLYVEFANVDGSGPSSTIITANMGTEDEVESFTTGPCSGFSSLFQSGYYGVLETFMGRHSLIFWAEESTSNIMLEGDNEGANEE